MAVVRYKNFILLEKTGIDLMKTHFGTINCKPSDDIVSDQKQ